MYKVFFNECFLIFADNEKKSEFTGDYVLLDYSDVPAWLEEIEKGKRYNALVKTDALDKLWKGFCEKFKIIEAAGGVVRNNFNEILFIYRRKKWDLPKGKLDKGEIPEKAAIREVQEETGLEKVIVEKPVCNTYHIYRLKDKLVLKTTYWYSMLCRDCNTLIPQQEEDIEKAEWVPNTRLKNVLADTYGTIYDVIEKYKPLNTRFL